MIVVIDVGTSSVRAVAVDADGAVRAERRVDTLPTSPAPGLVEFDPVGLARAAQETASAVIDDVGSATAVGIACQRASTVVWDRRSHEPVGPGLGWQDLRTVGRCLELRAAGIRVAPNATATRAEWLLGRAHDQGHGHDRSALRVGTIDAWLTSWLSDGAVFATDATNAGVTDLSRTGSATWDADTCAALSVDVEMLPTIVDSSGVAGVATALPGAPPIAALIGDQQASLIGQGCHTPGDAKLTFGTGAMLDAFVGAEAPSAPAHGTFPIVAHRIGGVVRWGIEATDLSAGAAVEWLRDGLGLIAHAAETATLATSVPDSDGVVFVPSLSGTGTPEWDHGARGALFGVTRGTTRAHVVRAVLDGVAQRAADLTDAAQADAGIQIAELRVDGGMTANTPFVQLVADAVGRPVVVSAEREATAMGAAHLAGCAVGTWTSLDEAATTLAPGVVVEPEGGDGRRDDARQRFADARRRAGHWIPEISALDL